MGWTREQHGQTALRALPALFAAAFALTASATNAQADSPGQVKFMLHATSSFDPYLTDSTSSQQQWMRDHYWRMRGYAPFFTWYGLGWAPPSHFYRDLLAIYNKEEGLDLIEQNPDWVLRDSNGDKLFIDYGCSGGTCPQYAADIGNSGFRSWWIEQAGADLAQGYAGIFVDDVNLDMTTSDGNGDFARPIDLRTDEPMTDADWRRYMAEFTEEIRTAFPEAEIAHNPLWWMDHDDPYVQRQIDAADFIEVERGFNDQGIVGGGGKWGYETYLAHIDWLHSRGKAVIYEPKQLDPTSLMFELASYFLVNEGDDLIASDYRSNPDDWWVGWDIDLGDALGPRYAWEGLFRRDFAEGVALVNQPDSPTRTVQLAGDCRWTDPDGNEAISVALRARQGTVLHKEPIEGASGESCVLSSATNGQVTLKAARKKVRRGARLRLRGRAPGADNVIVSVKRRGSWHPVATTAPAADSYQVKVRVGRRGARRYRADAPDLAPSGVVTVRVKG
jgi:hypothetical protein